MKSYRISVIPGDGIGMEVIPEGLRILEKVATIHKLDFEFEYHAWGSQYYSDNGVMMPDDSLEKLCKKDAIYLGAVGDPQLQDNITLEGLLLPIRRTFQQFANVRPSFLFEGVTSPLKNREPGSIDCVVVRENTEGEYSQVGGRMHRLSDSEVAIQTSVFTYHGTEKIIRFSFELAKKRGKKHKVTSITKSNALGYGMTLWDEIFQKVAHDYPSVETESLLVDAACMDLIQRPEDFDVIVASNLFGDIVSEITAAITGSLGLAASANINPDKKYPSMFEPVHGSAPNIAGKGIANPLATILAAHMMLDFLGEKEAAQSIYIAVTHYLKVGTKKTPDLKGSATCKEATEEILTFL